MNVEMIIVLAMAVLLVIAIILNDHPEKKDSQRNDNSVKNYVETKTMEMPRVDF